MQNMYDTGQMTAVKLSILDQHKAVQVAPSYDIMLDDGTSVSVFNN